MYSLDKLKKEIAKLINEALGGKIIQASDLVYPPQGDMGDFSLLCFNEEKLGLSVGKLFSKVSNTKPETWGVSLVGKFLNFKIDKSALTRDVIKEIDKAKQDYGHNNIGRNKRVMVEYSNANTHKEYHIGHLRNITYGDAIHRLLMANGYESIPASYLNDFGIHVAKTLWAFSTLARKKKLPKNKGEYLGKIYVKATQAIKEDLTAKQMVEVMMKKIESREGREYELWQETRQWSIDQFNEIYKELGVKFVTTFFESDYIEKGRKMVNELIKHGVLRESEGAVIADLADEGLGVLVVLRSDGTATYPVADIPLTEYKFKKFKLDKAIWVVDVRQALYFKQLFAIMKRIGVDREMIHLGHDFVKLPSGMMSSRLGNVITYEELKTELLDQARTETKKRHDKWDKEKIETVAWQIAVGAMKFEMLKVGANQEITFEIKKALSFSGFTAAYLQYTYARINSIIRKSEVKGKKSRINYSLLGEQQEQEMVLKLAKYPESVARANKDYDPSVIAKYLFELAQDFNDYYHQIPVLKAEAEIRDARLALIKVINQVLRNGLELLGINIMEEM